MADLLRFISVLLLIGLLVFLQGARFLSVGGVNPNLIFVFFAGLLLSPAFRKNIHLDYFLMLLGFSFLIGSFLFGFWMVPWLALTAFLIAIYFLRNFMTGHPFPDFAALIFLGTFLFYGLLKLLGGGFYVWGPIFGEAVYNLALGTILWSILHFLSKYEKFRS